MKNFLIFGFLIGLCSCASNKKSEVRSDYIKVHCQDTVLVCLQFSETVKSLDCVYDPLLVNEHCRKEK